MLYSSSCAYAVRALSRLASSGGEDLVKLHDLAHEEEIPYPFLAKIFNDLVSAGLVRSARGPRGGYALTREPREISLHDIRAAIDGIDDLERCVLGLKECPGEQTCAMHDSWKPLRGEIERYLLQTTLADAARALDHAAVRWARRQPALVPDRRRRPSHEA
jgi:Rrf2 family transcriptional regulator, iron-sulfur cluster assembly transcription factor